MPKKTDVITRELSGGPVEYTKHHKDGSLWARGQLLGGVMIGYWEWFRIDGSKLRSGHFEAGEQVGEWITYDRNGEPHKVTTLKRKAGSQ